MQQHYERCRTGGRGIRRVEPVGAVSVRNFDRCLVKVSAAFRRGEGNDGRRSFATCSIGWGRVRPGTCGEGKHPSNDRSLQAGAGFHSPDSFTSERA